MASKAQHIYIKDSRTEQLAPTGTPVGCVYLTSNICVGITGGQAALGYVFWQQKPNGTFNDTGLPSDYYNACHGIVGQIVIVSGKTSASVSGSIIAGAVNSTTRTITWNTAQDPRKTVAGFTTGNSVYSNVVVDQLGSSAFVCAQNNDAGTYWGYYSANFGAASPTWIPFDIGVCPPIGVSIGADYLGINILIPGNTVAPMRVTGAGRTLYASNLRVFTTTNQSILSLHAGDTILGYTLQVNDFIGLGGQVDQKQNGVWQIYASPTTAVQSIVTPALLIADKFSYTKDDAGNTGYVYCTNATAPTYGVDNIGFQKIMGRAFGTTLVWACSVAVGVFQYIVPTANKAQIWQVTNWGTPGLKYTHTGDINWIQNLFNSYNAIACSSNGGIVFSNANGSAWTLFETTRKAISAYYYYYVDKMIVAESGNSDGDYFSLYNMPFGRASQRASIYMVNNSPRFYSGVTYGTFTPLSAAYQVAQGAATGTTAVGVAMSADGKKYAGWRNSSQIWWGREGEVAFANKTTAYHSPVNGGQIDMTPDGNIFVIVDYYVGHIQVFKWNPSTLTYDVTNYDPNGHPGFFGVSIAKNGLFCAVWQKYDDGTGKYYYWYTTDITASTVTWVKAGPGISAIAWGSRPGLTTNGSDILLPNGVGAVWWRSPDPAYPGDYTTAVACSYGCQYGAVSEDGSYQVGNSSNLIKYSTNWGATALTTGLTATTGSAFTEFKNIAGNKFLAINSINGIYVCSNPTLWTLIPNTAGALAAAMSRDLSKLIYATSAGFYIVKLPI